MLLECCVIDAIKWLLQKLQSVTLLLLRKTRDAEKRFSYSIQEILKANSLRLILTPTHSDMFCHCDEVSLNWNVKTEDGYWYHIQRFLHGNFFMPQKSNKRPQVRFRNIPQVLGYCLPLTDQNRLLLSRSGAAFINDVEKYICALSDSSIEKGFLKGTERHLNTWG